MSNAFSANFLKLSLGTISQATEATKQWEDAMAVTLNEHFTRQNSLFDNCG
jgi:hypothetical protein